MVRPTTKFSATLSAVVRSAPRLGEHTQSVLEEAGFSAERIALLCRSEAI